MIKQTPEKNKSEIKQTNVFTRIGKSFSCTSKCFANTMFSNLPLNFQIDLSEEEEEKKRGKILIFNTYPLQS